MSYKNMIKKKTIDGKKDAIILPLMVIVIMVIGVIGLYYMQKAASGNKYICTYLGRLWLPDKEQNNPDFHKCYTYEEYYK